MKGLEWYNSFLIFLFFTCYCSFYHMLFIGRWYCSRAGSGRVHRKLCYWTWSGRRDCWNSKGGSGTLWHQDWEKGTQRGEVLSKV